MNKPRDPKMYYGMAGAAVVAGAAFIWWQNMTLEPLRQDAATLAEKSKEQDHIYQKLDQAKKDEADLQAKLAHVEQGVPDLAYVPTMLKELALAGKQLGVEVTGIRPVIKGMVAIQSDKEKERTKKPYEPLDIEMKGKCKYSDLVQFVTSLDRFPKIVTVRTIGITPPAMGQKRTDMRLDFTLGMRAFLFKSKDEAPKPKEDGGSV